MPKNRYLILFVFVLANLLSGCTNSNNKEINKVLSDRQKAFESKDVKLYLSTISTDYNQKVEDKVVDFDLLKKRFESNTKVFDSISITRKDINIYKKSDSLAEVYQKSQYDLKIETQATAYRTVEKLVLEKKNGSWKITKEADLDLFTGFVFGSK